MKRLLLIGSVLLLGCGSVKLEDFPRPYACDHEGPSDAGQCSRGWSCGFDDRCFRRNLSPDAGVQIDLWRCTNDTQCPEGWQCGEEVDSIRNCQQLGVGAPSRCLTDDPGCQGGWRCGAAARCFDPSDTDGGTERDCTEHRQCPDNYRCGELVEDRGQHCLLRDAGAPSDCNTDFGCEGSFRCDIYDHRCVEITDVIGTGSTLTLGSTELNPRRHEGAPAMFAMTRLTRVPVSVGSPMTREGVLMTSVFGDGGLRVTTQFSDELRQDGGATVILFERTVPLPGNPADLLELAVATEGPAVRFRDGGAARLPLFDGGGWEFSPSRIDLLRQNDPLMLMGPESATELILAAGNQVFIDGRPPLTLPGRVHEVIAGREGLYVLTDAGFFVSDGGAPTRLMQGPSADIALAVPSRGAVAGYLDGPPNQPPLFALFAELPRPGGGSSVVSVFEGPIGFAASLPSSACPDGGAPLQLAFDVEAAENDATLFSRCAATSSTSFPVQLSFRGMDVEYQGVIEDQVPSQWGVVAQRAGPFVRAHAGADGHIWHAIDPDGRGRLARLKLRPVLLDRQPDTLISFVDQATQAVRVFAEANGDIYAADPFGGFVSQIKQAPLNPISTISSRGWIVATGGLLATEGGQPRLIATIEGGATFAAPASGVSAQMQLGGRLRDVVLVASYDTIWFADVTDAQSGPFAQPAVFSRVLVPVPGVPLRSLTLEPAPEGTIAGYFTTSTTNFRFDTSDLLRWRQTAVPTSAELTSLPLEVWSEADGGRGRTGFSDGRVWSLPIMVPLTAPLVGRDGGALSASDFARKCGDVFASTTEGIFRAEASPDGGLPRWAPVTLGVPLDSTQSLRLYETRDLADRLFVGTRTGQVIEVTGTCR